MGFGGIFGGCGAAPSPKNPKMFFHLALLFIRIKP
jgi:hypothetical protein